jgi:hypothetical protein
MIDEADLRALLAEAADAAPAPGRAPEELLAALRTDAGTTPVPAAARVRANPRALVLAAAAAVVVLGLVRALPGDQLPGPSLRSGDRTETVADFELQSDGGTTGGGAVPTTLFRREVVDGASRNSGDGSGAFGPGAAVTDGGENMARLGVGQLEAGGGGSAAPTAGAATGDVGETSAPTQATDGAMVVKTAALVLEIEAGAYAGTVERIETTALGLGGYVADLTTNRSDQALGGSITVRVPAASFDDVLAQLRGLGTVDAESVKGADVTAQHTDLEARLASVTATRDRLQTLLAEASNVGDLLAIQDRITGVQTEIEQLQGQLRDLDDQVAMGMLTVSLAEPGADQVDLTATAEDEGLGGAWDDARRRFGNGLEDLVSWSGSGAVLALLAAIVVLAGRPVWQRLRRYWL